MRTHLLLRGMKTSVALVPLLLSGCGWYMDMSNSIGSHMPTYDDWFGDKPKPNQQSGYNQYQPDPYSYGMPAPQANMGEQPAPPRGAPMPQGYYQTERVQAGQQQQYMMAPSQNPQASPYGMPPQMMNGPAPDEGLRRMQMQQMQQMPPPTMPFTQPDLVVPEQQVIVEEQSGTVVKELPSDLPPTEIVQQPEKPESRGTFAFVDDIAEVVGGWFGDSEETKKPYPNLATVPQFNDYQSRQAAMNQAEQELLQDRSIAEAKQREITDWSELADAAPASAPAPEPQPPLAVEPLDAPLQAVSPEPEPQLPPQQPAPVIPQVQAPMEMPVPQLKQPQIAEPQAPQPDSYTVLEEKFSGAHKSSVAPREQSLRGAIKGLFDEKPKDDLFATPPAPQRQVANPVPPSAQTVIYRNDQMMVLPPEAPGSAVPPAPAAVVLSAPAPNAPAIYVPQQAIKAE